MQKYSAIALTVLNKAFSDVEIIALIDRDDNLEEMKQGKTVIKKLARREFENYLFDKELLKKYCIKQGKEFKETEFINYNNIYNCPFCGRSKDNNLSLINQDGKFIIKCNELREE